MDLDQLQSVRDRERQTDRLQQLREEFYEDAAAFVADLRAERNAAAAESDDPFDSPQVSRLSDRIRTAEQTLEAIYEKRVGKVVKAATFAAADLPAEADGMTKEEAELFDTLVAEIEANRAEVLGRLSAGSGGKVEEAPGPADESVAADEPEPAGATPDDAPVDAADVMGGESAGAPDADPTPPPPDEPIGGEDSPAEDEDALNPDTDAPAAPPKGGEESADDTAAGDATESGAGSDDVARELVRITDDVGPILGVDDREYDLATDDVVTLPTENARPLVERGAAERLE